MKVWSCPIMEFYFEFDVNGKSKAPLSQLMDEEHYTRNVCISLCFVGARLFQVN